MVARPGRLQSGFTAGELEPLLHERTQLKYFSTGASYMENVEVIPQGGFRYRGGLRDIGGLQATASRLFPFEASDGSSYDLVFSGTYFEAWSATAKLQTVAIGMDTDMLPEMTVAQQLDTMLVFHRDLQTQRIKHLGPTNWQVDNAPFDYVFNYDYGGPVGGGSYSNGVAAVWELEFVGLTNASTVFVLTVSGQDTVSILYNSAMTTLATNIEASLLDLPNISSGISVVSSSGDASGTKIKINFTGSGNEGDGWAVSGRVLNKSDAAVLAFKETPGVTAGEPVFSSDRGWPHCGTFYAQRLLLGGFKSLPNAWCFSKLGDFYNFDERFTEANGPALIPMDISGGERIERIFGSRNLLIFTTQAEYWLAERKLSRTEAPNHVQSSTNGTKRGVPITENEGAAIYVQSSGGVLGEFRYTDVEGNFVSTDISLLASHLVEDVIDQAVKKATKSTNGNRNALVLENGDARLVTILREQEVTGFTRMTTAGDFKATSVNGRNELNFIVARADGRRLEKLDDTILLDQATLFENDPASTDITGLSRFNGQSVWVVADDNVFGPYTVSGGEITLPVAASAGYVGTWSAPRVTTLPPPRDIGPGTVLKRKGRIHSVQISVINTTSIAIASQGGPLRDIDLLRYGAPADQPELQAGYTGTLTIRGLTGFHDEPTITIGQVRPGRMTVRSITIEAAL
ncbi:MAG: hypothetical protein CMF72_22640 [Mameliella sp.]|nr:hypothetical protein [Mameliella sp.]